jgi:hypothetical protein
LDAADFAQLQAEIDRLAPLAFDRGLAALQPSEQRLLLVWSYVGAIDNGGHASFLCNSYGDEWAETIAALDAIGARDHAQNLQQLDAVFEGSAVPRDHGLRNQALLALSPAAEQRVADCDATFDRLNGSAPHDGMGSDTVLGLALADWRAHVRAVRNT